MSLQGEKVLILNQDYQALAVCSIQKAFVLMYLNKAELVEEHPQRKLRTVSDNYPFPSIIRLFRYVQRPYRGVMLTRQNVFRRDSGSCLYCGSKSDLTIDHVLPKSRGGRSTWDNLATACRTCNARKGDLTPEEAEMPLSRAPFKPSFVMFLRDFSGNIQEDWLPYLGKGLKLY